MAIINGGSGDDALTGTKAADKIFGFAGSDFIEGLAGDDELRGGSEEDFIDGGNGNDKAFAESGNDVVLGGNGSDQLDGGTEHDQLFGGASRDRLNGGTGFDELHGEGGSDRLSGGDSDDVIFAGAGNDVLLGGPGFDNFFYDASFIDRRDDDLIGDFEKEADIIFVTNEPFRFEELFVALDSNGSGRLDNADLFVDIAPIRFEGTTSRSTVIDVGAVVAAALGAGDRYTLGDETLTVFGVTGLTVDHIAGD